MSRKWSELRAEVMLRVVIVLCLWVSRVRSGSDICKNGAKIDSMTYMPENQQFFITSGGNFWFLKDSYTQSNTAGDPLPGGFTRGDAAVFVDTMDICKGKGEKLIHLVELTSSGNKVMTYDVRTNQWNTNLIDIKADPVFSSAKLDLNARIDAAFVYEKTNIIVFQHNQYSVVDIKNICAKPPASQGFAANSVTDMNIDPQRRVDAISYGRGSKNGSLNAMVDSIFMFQHPSYWTIFVKSITNGKVTATKSSQMDIFTKFFNFNKSMNCQSFAPPTEAPLSLVPPPKAAAPRDGQTPGPGGDSNTTAGEAAPPPAGGADQSAGETSTAAASKEEEKSNNSLWIIIVIIVIIIIVIAIVLCVCLASKKKDKEDKPPEGGAGAAADAGVGAAGGSKTGAAAGGAAAGGAAAGGAAGASGKTLSKTSNMGSSPSTMSVRSTTGANPKAGSKVGSKAGSKH